jgi:type II secretory pathway component PulM
MDRNFVAALAVLALLAGGALYFVNAAHEREIAGLRRLLEEARQHAAGSEKARRDAERARAAAETARSEGEEMKKAGEAQAQKAAADAARQAREAARSEAIQIRIDAAKRRAEEETRAKERVEQPKLPEVRLKPKPE